MWKLLFFCLLNTVLCSIITTTTAFHDLPTDEACAQNPSEFCHVRNCSSFYAENSVPSKYIELPSSTTANLLLEFYVIGSSECNVRLSPVANPNQTDDRVYHILIGGFNNSRTFIRQGKQIILDNNTKNVLSKSQPVQIRIERSPNGFIQIYNNNVHLVRAVDRRPAPIRYFSFASDPQIGMHFYYDCLSSDLDSDDVTTVPNQIRSAHILSMPSSVSRMTSQVHVAIYAFAILYICLVVFNCG